MAASNHAPRVNPYRVFRGAFIPNAVLMLPREQLSSDAKLCYARLLQYAGKNGVAYPHVATLMSETGLSSDRAERALRALRGCGLISSRKRGPGKSALVFFHLPSEVFGAVDNSNNPAPVRVQGGLNPAPVRVQKPGALKGSRARPEESHKQKGFTAPRGGTASRRSPVFTTPRNPGQAKRVLQLLSGIGKKI